MTEVDGENLLRSEDKILSVEICGKKILIYKINPSNSPAAMIPQDGIFVNAINMKVTSVNRE